MARPSSSQPTEVELQILNVLWEKGPATVREVFQILSENKKTSYTSVLKMMQVMHQKGLLIKDESVRPQLYGAAKSKSDTQTQMLNDIKQKVFHGSAMRLVMNMVSSGQISPEELDELKNLAKENEK